MTVIIRLKAMEGPKQIVEVEFRIETNDFVDAVAQAVNQVMTMTTIEIESIYAIQ